MVFVSMSDDEAMFTQVIQARDKWLASFWKPCPMHPLNQVEWVKICYVGFCSKSGYTVPLDPLILMNL